MCLELISNSLHSKNDLELTLLASISHVMLHVRSTAVFQPQPPAWGAFRQLLSSAVETEPVIPTHCGTHLRRIFLVNKSLLCWLKSYRIYTYPRPSPAQFSSPNVQKAFPSQPILAVCFTAVTTSVSLKGYSQQVWWKYTLRSPAALLQFKLCCWKCFGWYPSSSAWQQWEWVNFPILQFHL